MRQCKSQRQKESGELGAGGGRRWSRSSIGTVSVGEDDTFMEVDGGDGPTT